VSFSLTRRKLLVAASASLAASACRSSSLEEKATKPVTATTLPVLFVGHGSPMNAIEDNEWSRGFQRIAALLPKPRAILSISAHWFVPGTFTTGNDRPETIHDFGGFPRPLFEIQYPAPGDPALARRVASLLTSVNATVRTDWGLDHGTWTVLKYLYPDASCPVVQLSIDHRAPPASHLAIGRALAPLRGEGVLILGSGNVTHNLRYAMTSMRSGDLSLPSWAESFDRDVAHALEQHDGDALARLVETDAGKRSHPTPDHYFPVLYAAGAASASDAVRFPVEGFDLGSLSMRSVIYG
jgi:4,5-DOPA dioxygenase extradiol